MHHRKWDAQIFGDFEIQMLHQISARRPDQVIFNKKREPTVKFAVPADHWVKLKESKKREIY